MLEGNVTVGCLVTPRQLEVVHKVFNTAELLEQILANLSPVDLLLKAELVCKGFHRIINTSPKISRAMFRRPVIPKAPQPVSGGIRLPPYRISGIRVRKLKQSILLFDIRSCTATTTNLFYRHLRPSQSLRRTLLAQPPPTYARVKQRCDCIFLDNIDVKIHVPGGLTFGKLFEAIDAIKTPCCRKVKGWTVTTS